MALTGDSQNISKISDMNEHTEIKGYSKLKNIETSTFGKVFAALHNPTNNLVALKIIESTFVKDPVKIKQFINENVAAGRLDHKNIAKVFESGKIGHLDYISMEFLNGRNLKSILNDVKVLNPYLATEIILRVTLALQFANDNALLHKGIKLENIVILDISKDVKLQGFGLAHGVRSEITEYKEILLDSLRYASPEQAAEKAIDFRSDIYSLGVCYYYLVTGKFPYDAKNPEELIDLHSNADIPKPSKLRFELNESIEATILTMLAKKPEERFNSYTDLIDKLVEILEIDDISSYLAQATEAEEAIAVDTAFSMDSMLNPAPQMIGQKGFVDINDDEIEEIDDDEIEEIEDVDEIEEIEDEPKTPLRLAPKKLRPGKKTEIVKDHKRKPTHQVKKPPKTRKYSDNDHPKRKRRPEEEEMPPRKKHKMAAKPQTKGSKIPPKMVKPKTDSFNKTNNTPTKVQPAPKPVQAPPLIPMPETDVMVEPVKTDPTPIPSVTKPVEPQKVEKKYSQEILESKTSSGKFSKAPKVPSGGGDKIRLNRGTLQLDSSSKLSDPDAKNSKDDEEKPEDIADISEIEVIEEDDFDERIK